MTLLIGYASSARRDDANTERTRWNVFETAIVIAVLPEDDPKLKKIGTLACIKT
jgi:hypothetical protein